MTSSTSTGGTLNNAAKVATSENNVVIKVQPLTQLTIQSPPHGQIEIKAGESIASIQNLKFVRNGDNLEIHHADGTRAAVIIEGYYAQETPPDIYGIDDQGNRYTWSSTGATSQVSALTDGESSVQEATPAMENTAEAPEEKQDDDDKGAVGLFGLSPGWAAAAAGLAAAAIAGGVIAATHDSSSDKNHSNGGSDGGNGSDGDNGSGNTGPTGTLSNIQFINDNDPSNPIVITNGMTNDKTPTITGKVEGAKEGDRVAIKDGDTVLGYAIVDKDGNWVFTPINDLGEGSHQITAELQDADGNPGHSQQVDLTIDTTPPDAAGNITVDGKPADGENLTGENKPTIGGDAEPGSTITITDGEGNVIGSAVADEDGHWEITPQDPLGDGNQDLIIDVTDPAGNNTSSELPINVDTIPPTGTISDIQFINDNDPANPTTITNGFTNDSTPVITGKVDGAEKGDRVVIKDGDTVLGSAVIDENGNWTFTPETPLGEGPHQITAELQDAAGNTGDSQQVDLTIDTTPPQPAGDITIDGKPADDVNDTDNPTPNIGGSAEPGSTVIIKDGEGNVVGSAVAGEDGHWEITPNKPLGDGNNNLEISVTDPAGNSTSSELPINLGDGSSGGDTTPPTGTLSDIVLINDNDPANPKPITDGLTNDSTPVITGKVTGAEPGDTVLIKDGDTVLGSAVIGEDGSWTFTPETPLGEGAHNLTVSLQDAAGNTGASQQVNVNIDTEAPQQAGDITIDGKPAEDVNDTENPTPNIGGSAEPGSTVTIKDGEGNVIGSAVAGDDGHWEITPNKPLGTGDNNLVIEVTDPAGNTSPATELPINLGDGSAPGDADGPTGTVSDIVLINDNDPANPKPITNGQTNDNTPQITGKANGAEAGDTVLIKDGDTILGSAVIGEDGTWTYTPTEPLGEGKHDLTVALQNADGKTGTSQKVPVTVDTVAPEQATDITVGGKPADADTPINNNKPTIAGKAEPGSTVTIKDGEGNVIGSAVADAEGKWEITPTEALPENTNDLHVTVTDPAGNSSAPSDLPITVDTTPPAQATDITVGGKPADADTPINNTKPTIAGKAEPGSTVTIKDGEGNVIGSAVADAEGKWEITPTEELKENANDLHVTVTDPAGNSSAPSDLPITVDTTPPAQATDITVGGKPADAETPINNNKPTIAGKAEPGSTVTIKDGEGNVIGSAVAGDDGKWEITPTEALPENANDLQVTVTDPAGNSSAPSELPITIDTTPPAAATDIKVTNDVTDTDVAAGGSTNDNTPTISGKAEAGSIVNILDKDGNILASTTADANGDWSAQIPSELADGRYDSMQVQVVDGAGNESPLADVPDFNVDTINTNSTTISTNAEVANPMPEFSGKVTLGEEDTDYSNMTITIKDRNGEVIATGIQVNPDGTWSYTPTEPLSSGPHNISAVVVDEANNESQPGYLNGTEDGSWSVPAVLYSEASGGEGDLFGYAIVSSGDYIYISAPNGGLNDKGSPTNQGIIYAIKKDFAYLLDGSSSIEKIFAANPGMGTIITNNGDTNGDGTPDTNGYQGYGMKVLDGGWVAIYMHEHDTVYFVQESKLTDDNFDLKLISDAPDGKSEYGFMMTNNDWGNWFAYNIASIVNGDGTLTFLIDDLHGARSPSGSITTLTFTQDGNWVNMHMIKDPNDTTDNGGWIPTEELPEGMVIGKIGHENSNGTTGSTQNNNFGADIVNVGDIFGNGHQYLAIMDPESAHSNQSFRGTWYFYQIPDGGLPNNFNIGDVPDDQLIVITNIGAGLLNEISNDVRGDFGSDEYKPHNHNMAVLGNFSDSQNTDIAIGSATDSQGGANGKVWVLHSNKITGDINIGVNSNNPKFDTDLGYAIVSKKQTGQASKNEGFGLNVIGGYDMNGDGTQDLIISDPLAAKDGKYVGAVYIVYGGHAAEYQEYLQATGEIDIQTILDNGWGEVHYGSVDGQCFGWSVEVIDMNNDGMMDMLVGAPSELGGGTTTDPTTGVVSNPQYNGQVYVVYNSHTAPAEETPASRSYSLPADEQDHHDNGIPLLLDGDHQNVDLAALTDSLKDTHSIDMSNGDNTLKVNNQTLDSWEGADGDALIVSGENGLVQLTGGIDNWHSNGTVTVDGKEYTEYQSSGMAEVLIDDRIHVNIL